MKDLRIRPLAKLIVAISLIVLQLSGCAGMQPGYESPTVSVQSFRAVSSETGTGLPSFEIGLRVINPNLEPLELAGVSYTVSLDGNDIIKGVGNDLPVIDGYGEGTFTVTAAVDVLAGVRLLRSLMDKNDDTFEYAFEAKLDPGVMRRKIRVRDSGSISLSAR
jgi:LEA14-like dessication related protein